MAKDERQREEHPSYGVIAINRFSSNGARFFDSPIRHDGGISIEISTATVARHQHLRWVHDDKMLIRVEMSAEQFARAITTMNTVGVPCTLSRVRDDTGTVRSVPRPPDEFHREPFEADVKDAAAEASKRLDSVVEKIGALMQKGSATKRDLADLAGLAQQAQMHLKQNLPYVITCFREAMDHVETVAKVEIAGFMETALRTAGLDALANRLEAGGGLRALLPGQDPKREE